MSSLVKNMLLSVGILCVAPLLITRTTYAQVIITEIMYDPPGGDNGHEWVEIMNDSNTPVNIQNLRFVEADTKHRIKKSVGETDIAPGAVAVIAQDSAQFKNDYQTYQGAIFLSSFNLRQQKGLGEPLGIYNTATDRMEYEATYTPNELTNNTGASLHLTLGGTQVAAPATPGSIAINPITTNPKIAGEEAEKITEEQPMERITETAALKGKNDRATDKIAATLIQKTLSTQQREKISQSQNSPESEQNNPSPTNKNTSIFHIIALLLGIVVIELWVIIKRLRRRLR